MSVPDSHWQPLLLDVQENKEKSNSPYTISRCCYPAFSSGWFARNRLSQSFARSENQRTKSDGRRGAISWRRRRDPQPQTETYREGQTESRSKSDTSSSSLEIIFWRLEQSASLMYSVFCGALPTCAECSQPRCTNLWTRPLLLTLWRPLLPYGYSYKASFARPG